MEERDITTTPRWLQVPGIALLSAAGLYFVLCFSFANADSIPPWAWMGRWKMFSWRGTWHYQLEAEVLNNGQWSVVDPVTLFPFQTEAGPRFARSAFFKHKGRMQVLAEATCGRLSERPERVRYYVIKWKATPGQLEQPLKRVTRELQVDWRCGGKVTLPEGRRI